MKTLILIGTLVAGKYMEKLVLELCLTDTLKVCPERFKDIYFSF